MIPINALARAVGGAPQTARNWITRHDVPRQDVGGRLLVPRATIRAYRASQQRMRAKPLTAVDIPPALRRALHGRVRPVGDCRVWTGTTDSNAYGTFVHSVKLIVHRAA